MRLTLAATGVLLVLAVSGCDRAATPPTESSSPAENGSPAATETVQARVTQWDPEGRAIVLDRVAMLSGEEAVAAARQDGQMPEGEDTLPNDFYIDDLPDEPGEVPVAADATARVFDCTASCELTDVDVDDLLAGRARPMNGDGAVFELRLRDGVVVALAEIYVP